MTTVINRDRVIQEFSLWKEDCFFDEETRLELQGNNINDNYEETEAYFCKDIGFGTSGLQVIRDRE